MLKFISILDNYLHSEKQSCISVYLLNISKACLGAGGMLHFGVADGVGQYPVISTRIVRSTPPKDTCAEEKDICPPIN